MARYVDIECSAVTEVIGRRTFKSREDIQNFLDNIPTADVEPVKHGRWLIGYYPYCSECKCEPDGRKMSKHCPNCGVKMDGDKFD